MHSKVIQLYIRVYFQTLCLVKVKAAQLCPTLCDPMDYTVHKILQTRTREWVAILFSRDLPDLVMEPGLPRWWCSGKEFTCQYRRFKRCEFYPWRREDSLEDEMATHSSISCLKNFLDRGVWQATVRGVAESNTTK